MPRFPWLLFIPILTAGIALRANAQSAAGELRQAVLLGDMVRAQALLAAGADVTVRYNGGKTLLHLAATQNNTAVIQALLSAHADPNTAT